MQYKYSYKELWQPKNYEVTFRMCQLNFDGIDRTYMEYWDKYPHFIEDNLLRKIQYIKNIVYINRYNIINKHI